MEASTQSASSRSTSTQSTSSRSALETKELAGKVAPLLKAGDVILFSGELGAGKTTFIQGLAEALGSKENALSPTFVIAHQYQAADGFTIHHLDLYRLEDMAELEPIFRDLLDELGDDGTSGNPGILLVEWGERLKDSVVAMPDEYLEIAFKFANPQAFNMDSRILEFLPTGESWNARLSELAFQEKSKQI